MKFSSNEACVLRQLRQSQLQIYNRLRSIRDDAVSVDRIIDKINQYFDHHSSANEHRNVFANRRCGEWYVLGTKRAPCDIVVDDDLFELAVGVEEPQGLLSSEWTQDKSKPKVQELQWVHFKSTDATDALRGMFSFQRVNMQLLYAVQTHGFAIVVDATRRGKLIPDALSRTLPIWVTVVNRIYIKFGRLATCIWEPGVREQAAQLHVANHVSESEKDQIGSHLDEWVDTWASTAGEEYCASFVRDNPLQMPLKVVWISREDEATITDWNDWLQSHESHGFSPIFAISASRLHKENDRNQVSQSPCLCEQDTANESTLSGPDPGVSFHENDNEDTSDDEIENENDDYDSIHSYHSPASSKVQCLDSDSEHTDSSFIVFDQLSDASDRGSHLRFCKCGSRYSYYYIQGAGDDEENWSLGLTAFWFWRHHRQILQEPDMCEERIKKLVESCKSSEAFSEQVPYEPLIFASLWNSGIYVGSFHGLLKFEQLLGNFGRVAVLHYDSLPAAIASLREKHSQIRTWYLCDESQRADYRFGLQSALSEILFDLESSMERPVLLVCRNGDDESVAVAMARILTSCKEQAISKSGFRSILLRLCMLLSYTNPSRSTLKQLNRALIPATEKQGDY